MRDHPFRWSLVTVLTIAVLVAGLLLVPWGGDQAVAKEPRATLGKVMVPAAAFIPNSDNWDYRNSGYYLVAFGTTAQFAAPLWFPVPEVNIRKITLIAHHNMGGDNLCVALLRAQPLGGTESDAGEVCTASSTDDPQKVAKTDLSPRRVNTVNHGPYLLAEIPEGKKLYGVQVVYSY